MIPSEFKLFNSTIKVLVEDELCNELEVYGRSTYDQSKIILASTVRGYALDHDFMEDTFYHEKVHMILDAMKRSDLSSNEVFVDTFAKLLRQTDLTSK